METLIEEYLGYAHAIARELLSRYTANITRADLESAAEFGLVQAARSYDPSRGISFSTFSYYRIRGAIFDEIRQLRRVSSFEIAANDYMTDHTLSAKPGEDLGAACKEIRKITSSVVTSYLLSLASVDGERIPASGASPANELLDKEQATVVRRALDQLPERFQTVVRAYYYQDLSFEEIGRQLNLSKSWVSRIHSKALSMLADILAVPERSGKASSRQTREPKANGRSRSNSSASQPIIQWNINGSSNQQRNGEIARSI